MDQLTSKYARGFGLSLIVVILFNGILTVIKEAFDPLLKGMAAITGHHWITHGIIVMLLFFVLGIVFSGARPQKIPWPSAGWISTGTVLSVIIGGILIGGYYLIG